MGFENAKFLTYNIDIDILESIDGKTLSPLQLIRQLESINYPFTTDRSFVFSVFVYFDHNMETQKVIFATRPEYFAETMLKTIHPEVYNSIRMKTGMYYDVFEDSSFIDILCETCCYIYFDSMSGIRTRFKLGDTQKLLFKIFSEYGYFENRFMADENITMLNKANEYIMRTFENPGVKKLYTKGNNKKSVFHYAMQRDLLSGSLRRATDMFVNDQISSGVDVSYCNKLYYDIDTSYKIRGYWDDDKKEYTYVEF